MKMETLKQLAVISRGPPKGRLADSRDEGLEAAVMQPNNLGSVGVTGELTVATVAKYKLETYQLRADDVLVSLLDPPDVRPRVGLVTTEMLETGSVDALFGGSRPLVAGANVAVLRVKTQRLDPRYLMLYLRSQDATSQLRAARGGSAQAYLSTAALGEIRLPLAPLDEQRRAAELHDNYERYALETQQLLSAERRLVEARFDQWVRNLAHG